MARGEFVTALARGLSVLQCFDRGHKRMTLSQVAERTDLTRGTARRLLLTLCSLDFIATDGKLFWLTPKVLRFSSSYLSIFGLGNAANAIITKVSETLHESSSMAVLDGPEIIYVARVEVQRIYSSGLEVGSRLPAYCSSLGQVLLAGLDEETFEKWIAHADLRSYTERTVTDPDDIRMRIEEARKNRFAINDGDLELGVRSIAVPVSNDANQTIASLNVATSAARTTLPELRDKFLPVLREAAAEMGRIIGDW